MEKTRQNEQTPPTLCSQLKSFLFTDHIKGTEIQQDLSDKNTFFAWQRNHMANERTFLAWCRTGISFIVFSFVIERFDLVIRELRFASPHPERYAQIEKTQYVSIITFILGAFIMVLAGGRFFYMRRHINRAETEFSTLPDILLLISVSVTLVMIFLLFLFVF
jgi:putative membrane protein